MGKSNRIEWIDALRGFTMILVVFWHVSMNFGMDSTNSILNSFFLTFRMPIFFFVSGLIGYKAIEQFTGKQYLILLKRKAFCQLVPTAIFFTIFSFVAGGTPLSFFTKGLEGYWFTLVLFELFVLYYTLSFIFNKCFKDTSIFHFSILFIVIAFLFNALALYMNVDLTRVPRVCIVLTLNNFCYYTQFFFFGILCRMYAPSFYKLLDNKIFITLVLSGFLLLFILVNTVLTNDFNKVIHYVLDSIVIKYFALLALFLVFYRYQDMFDSNRKFGQVLQYVGKHTLDIYLLHYFFVPNMHEFKYLISTPNENIPMEIFLVGIITIIVISICLLVSKILRISPILTKYLFGVFPKTVK